MATRAEAKEEEGKKLQLSLDKLADWEKDMNDVEKEVEIHRMKKTQPMYEKRRSILKTIPKFWYIVLAENDDFSDYISPEDLKFLEYIDDIYVHYPIVDGHADHFRDFNITISFGKSKLIPQQEVTKKFKTIVKEDGEECIESEPVDIQWPKELSKINPISIKEKYQGKDKKEMSPKDKMNYRLGMKSFFSWFRWTGKKPGKEFRNGDEVANLLVDLFLNGVKFYILGLNESEGDEEELDSSEGEELDISDDDYDADKEEPPSKRAKTE